MNTIVKYPVNVARRRVVAADGLSRAAKNCIGVYWMQLYTWLVGAGI